MVTFEKEVKNKEKAKSILLAHLFFLELLDNKQVVSLSQAYRLY